MTGLTTASLTAALPRLAAAMEAGGGAATILDGRVPHALLIEVFTEHGIGTQIRRDLPAPTADTGAQPDA